MALSHRTARPRFRRASARHDSEESDMVGEQPRSRPPDSTSAPWLVFLHGKNNKCHQTFFSLTESRFYVRHIREMSKNYWWPSSQGWLLILEPDSSNCFLLNPMTMQRIELPPLVLLPPSDRQEYKLVLSSSPVDPDIVVMLVSVCEDIILFYHMGAHRDWILYKYSTMLQENDYITEVASSNGRFYGCTFQSNICLIEIVPCPRLTLVEMERTISPPGFSRVFSSLVESCGEIYKVIMFLLSGSLIEGDIRVYKMDTSKQKWCMVDSIGDRVFFLDASRICSGSYSASKLGLKGNCIYYLRCNDTCLYAFDMEKGTVLVDMPCPNVRPPWFRPFWIMPAV